MTNSAVTLVTSLPAWHKVRAQAVAYYHKHQGAGIVAFDNADPAFPPFEPILTMIGNIFSRPTPNLRDLMRQYISANDMYGIGHGLYNAEIFGQYLTHHGLKPPTPLPGQRAGFINEHMTPGIGATHLYRLALESMMQPGDICIVTGPTYGLFSFTPILEHLPLVTLPLSAEDGWKTNPQKLDALGAALPKDRKKLFLHMSPHNPLGTVDGPEIINGIAHVCQKHDIFVVDDLAYFGLEYGARATPIASIDGMADRTLTLFSLSKAMGVPTLRAAMGVGPEPIISGLVNKMFYGMESPALTTHLALLAALNMTEPLAGQREAYLRRNAAEYEKRRDLVHGLVNGYQQISADMQPRSIQIINEMGAENPAFNVGTAFNMLNAGIPGVRTLAGNLPEAGYFQLLDFSACRGKFYGEQEIRTSMDVALLLAEQGGVCVLPGELIQFEGKELVARISYALPPEEILKGFTRIGQALEMLRDEPYKLKDAPSRVP